MLKEAAIDYAKSNYGLEVVNQSQTRSNRKWTEIKDIAAAVEGKEVLIRARIHTSRAPCEFFLFLFFFSPLKSKTVFAASKLCFVVLRHQYDTVQAVLDVDADTVSKSMVKFASK